MVIVVGAEWWWSIVVPESILQTTKGSVSFVVVVVVAGHDTETENPHLPVPRRFGHDTRQQPNSHLRQVSIIGGNLPSHLTVAVVVFVVVVDVVVEQKTRFH